MTKILKRPLSILLAVLMIAGVFAALPLTAYAATSHGITINTAQHGTVTATVNGSAATSAEEGATVTLTANPDNGYRLKTVSGTYQGPPEEKLQKGAATRTGSYFTLNASNSTNAGWTLYSNSTITITTNDTGKNIGEVVLNITPRKGFAFNEMSVDHGSMTRNGNDITISGINSSSVVITGTSRGGNYGCVVNSATITGTGTVAKALSLTSTGDDNVKTFTMPSGNVTITAEFEELPKYTVTWKNEDGTTLETDTDVAEGTTPTYDGETPTKAADADHMYVFSGWTPELAPVTEDVTYTATFTETEKPISSDDLYAEMVIDAGKTIEFTALQNGNTWRLFRLEVYLDDVLEKQVEVEAGSTTEPDRYYTTTKKCIVYMYGSGFGEHYLYLKSAYTVTWKDEDGTVLKTEDVAKGDTPSYGATPTKAEDENYTYTFSGWTPEITAVTGDVTYTATYTETAKPKDLFPQHSITLGGNIGVNFYIDSAAADFAHAGTAVVKFTWDNGNYNEEVDLKALTPDTSTGYYKATVDVVAAHMAHKIHAEVWLNGAKLEQTDDYSVQDYAETVFANPEEYDSEKPEQLKALAQALLNYGAMAQTVFDSSLKEHPALANKTVGNNGYADVTAEQIGAAINGDASDLNAIATQLGAKYYTNSLIYLSKNTLRIYFTPTSYPGEIPNASAYDGNLSGYYYYVDHENIPAAELDNQQTFTVGGTTFTFSALDYAKAVVNSGMGDDQKNLAKSLYLYNQKANAYFDVAHDHTPGEPVHVSGTPATCSAAGSYYEVTYCTKCGEEVSRVAKTIDKLAHTPGAAVQENVVPATCSATGSYDEVVYCTECHEELSRVQKTIDKLAHTPGAAVQENVVPASCSATGSYDEVVYCSECHEELSREQKTIDKLAHTPGEPVQEKVVPATCTAAGSYDEVVYCTECNAELSRETKTIDMLAHTIVAVAEVPATTEADGVAAHYECSVCHKLFSDAEGNNETTAEALVIPQIVENVVDLSTLTKGYEAQDGDVLINALDGQKYIRIADGATVKLRNANITCLLNNSGIDIAGLTLLGDATIILEGTNVIRGGYEYYPGIHVPEGKTLTIDGTGSLDVSSNGQGFACGIGSNYGTNCGNIVINGGNITAYAGKAAGIGAKSGSSCGNITINGGTVNATSGDYGAGIGSTLYGKSICGDITINGGIVNATANYEGPGIGSGTSANCGNITITGGTVTAIGGEEGAGIGTGNNVSICGNILITGGTVIAKGGNKAAGIGSGYKNSSCGTITITDTVTQVTATKGSNAPNSIGAGSNGSTCGDVTIADGANVTQN